MLATEEDAVVTRDTMLTVARDSDDLFARARNNIRRRKPTVLGKDDYEVLLRSLEATFGDRVTDALNAGTVTERELSKAECLAILRIVRRLCRTE